MKKIVLMTTVFIVFGAAVSLFAQRTTTPTTRPGGAAQPAAATGKQFDFGKWKTADTPEAVAAVVKSYQDDLKKTPGNAQFMAAYRTELDAIARDAKALPQSRYLAMLTIAGLSQEVNPYPDSLDTLLAAYNDADLPEIVRHAAFLGLSQHAKNGIADQTKNAQVIRIMSEIAVEPKAPEGRNPDIYQFARFRAVETLGTLKTYDPNAFRILVSLIDDKEKYNQENTDENDIRYLAVAMIGKMNLTELKPDPALVNKLAIGLVHLAHHACRSELAYLDNQSLQEQATASGGSTAGAGYSGGSPLGDLGMSSGGSGTTTLNMSPREKNRVENCISRIKFAFGSINEAIGTKAKPRVMSQIQSPETQKLLKDFGDRLTAFDTFINTGPKTLTTSTSSSDSTATTSGMSAAAAKAAAKAREEANKNALKVNEALLRVELQKYLLEFDALLSSPSGQTAGI